MFEIHSVFYNTNKSITEEYLFSEEHSLKGALLSVLKNFSSLEKIEFKNNIIIFRFYPNLYNKDVSEAKYLYIPFDLSNSSRKRIIKMFGMKEVFNQNGVSYHEVLI